MEKCHNALFVGHHSQPTGPRHGRLAGPCSRTRGVSHRGTVCMHEIRPRTTTTKPRQCHSRNLLCLPSPRKEQWVEKKARKKIPNRPECPGVVPGEWCFTVVLPRCGRNFGEKAASLKMGSMGRWGAWVDKGILNERFFFFHFSWNFDRSLW